MVKGSILNAAGTASRIVYSPLGECSIGSFVIAVLVHSETLYATRCVDRCDKIHLVFPVVIVEFDVDYSSTLWSWRGRLLVFWQPEILEFGVTNCSVFAENIKIRVPRVDEFVAADIH